MCLIIVIVRNALLFAIAMQPAVGCRFISVLEQEHRAASGHFVFGNTPLYTHTFTDTPMQTHKAYTHYYHVLTTSHT